MNMKIDAKELQDAIKQVQRKAPQEFMAKTQELADKVRDNTKEKTPVLTGNLKDSIKSDETKRSLGSYKSKVYSDARHAHLIEKGHRLVKGGRLGKGGRVIGFVHGTFMLEKTIIEENKKVRPDLENWVMNLSKELRG